MNKAPFSREKAIQAVNASQMIERYKKQALEIIKASQLSTAIKLLESLNRTQ